MKQFCSEFEELQESLFKIFVWKVLKKLYKKSYESESWALGSEKMRVKNRELFWKKYFEKIFEKIFFLSLASQLFYGFEGREIVSHRLNYSKMKNLEYCWKEKTRKEKYYENFLQNTLPIY